MTNVLKPKDHAEEMALFRTQVLGPVLHREFARGELKAELLMLSKRAFLPLESPITRTYSKCTLGGRSKLSCHLVADSPRLAALLVRYVE